MFKRICIVWGICLAIAAISLLGVKAINDCKGDAECRQATDRLGDATARLVHTFKGERQP